MPIKTHHIQRRSGYSVHKSDRRIVICRLRILCIGIYNRIIQRIKIHDEIFYRKPFVRNIVADINIVGRGIERSGNRLSKIRFIGRGDQNDIHARIVLFKLLFHGF